MALPAEFMAMLCGLALAGSSTQEPKGLVLVQKTVHAMHSLVGMVTQEETVKLQFSPSGLRMQAEGSQSPVIFRLERDGQVTRIEVNGLAKTFRCESFPRSAETLSPPLPIPAGKEDSGMLGVLAGLARAGGAASGPVTVKELPNRREIAGRRCRGVEFIQGGEKVLEAWYTEMPAPSWLRRFDIEEAPPTGNRQLLEARLKQPGIELESLAYLPGGGRYEVRTVSIKEEIVPPSAFQPPAGFKDVSKARPDLGGQR